MATATKRRRKARDEPVWMARLRIALLDVQPTIWRVVRVPAMISLDKLHDAIQAVMGWTDSHLHEFVINGVRYGIDDPTGFEDERVVDERQVTLADTLGHTVRTFDYVYDFGDNWHHAVTLEALEPTEGETPLLYCLAGERACPPEDVGGPWAYEEFLEAITDPQHEEHEAMLEWADGEFDPERFDPQPVNARLDRIKLEI